MTTRHDFGINAGWVSEKATKYEFDRQTLDDQWRTYFDSLLDREPKATSVAAMPASSDKQAAVTRLVEAYRARGHLAAYLDPLAPPTGANGYFELPRFGLSEHDLEEPFSSDIAPSIHDPDPPPPAAPTTLRQIIESLRETYCRTIGTEFTEIEDDKERQWLQRAMESTRNRLRIDRELALRLLARLTEAECLETFIHKQFIGAKRFSLQGGESLIPMLDLMVEKAASLGVDEIVLGMAHRGRLNVLVNIAGKDVREIFAGFLDRDPEKYLGSGDVKYHLGHSCDRPTSAGRPVHITLAFNPSHLEFVNPVVQGRVRGKQERKADNKRQRVVPILIHGDAAFMGQGVVPETLNLSGLEGYKTGGTIHIIANNQIGFTTDPKDSRSTRYASDLARMLKIPVFHVNSEDLESVAHVSQLAMQYRELFARDVVIDLYCYRRYGHNEGDEPRFTQPKMYQLIDGRPTIREVFAKEMVARETIDILESERMVVDEQKRLSDLLEYTKKNTVSYLPSAMGGIWVPYRGGRDSGVEDIDTGVPAQHLIDLARRLSTWPKDFIAHRKLVELYQKRFTSLDRREPFDWGTGEMLAFAALVDSGVSVRISGQDAQRGTFAHRHATLHDMTTGRTYTPLASMSSQQGHFSVIDSPLSEAAVLGFEYGYSLDMPESLVVWEAQFGDFANGAQVIVDQFISSAEDKWRRLSGLVLLLPHGYEGAGPEHSSARVERFLQLAAEDNMQVCQPTTAAQIFHLLRRQVLRPYRKPLVVFTPKSLLRAPAASSTIGDLESGRFLRVIGDASVNPSSVRRVLLCTGKVYYDLVDARKQRGIQNVAIIRLEQLYPLDSSLDLELAKYAEGTELRWVQDEPWNMGGAWFIESRLGKKFRARFSFEVVSRDESASPATGSHESHKLEQKMLADQAFGGLF